MRNQICNLFNSHISDKASSSKLWFHIANLSVTTVYVVTGLAIAKMPNPNIEGLSLLTFIYLGLVAGNKLANKILDIKYARENTNVSKPTDSAN